MGGAHAKILWQCCVSNLEGRRGEVAQGMCHGGGGGQGVGCSVPRVSSWGSSSLWGDAQHHLNGSTSSSCWHPPPPPFFSAWGCKCLSSPKWPGDATAALGLLAASICGILTAMCPSLLDDAALANSQRQELEKVVHLSINRGHFTSLLGPGTVAESGHVATNQHPSPAPATLEQTPSLEHAWHSHHQKGPRYCSGQLSQGSDVPGKETGARERQDSPSTERWGWGSESQLWGAHPLVGKKTESSTTYPVGYYLSWKLEGGGGFCYSPARSGPRKTGRCHVCAECGRTLFGTSLVQKRR
uniref:Uncharacterized protein n=1 Tax=Sphaerodactylus townsendi TaxID=933632 RepID=A0ACB8EYQ9_9SAUR